MTPRYRFWREHPLWTLTEAAYLLAGLAPLDDPKDAWFRPPPKAETFHARIKMAIATKDITSYKVDGAREMSVKPSDVIRWAQKRKYQIPSQLVRLAVADKINELGTRETGSLLKLVGGMAVAKYNWDPTVRSSVSRQISEDLQRLGVTLTDETIHKWLEAAAEHLPAKRK